MHPETLTKYLTLSGTTALVSVLPICIISINGHLFVWSYILVFFCVFFKEAILLNEISMLHTKGYYFTNNTFTLHGTSLLTSSIFSEVKYHQQSKTRMAYLI